MNIINFLIYSVGTSVLCLALAAVVKIISGNRRRAEHGRAQCENCKRLRRIERNWLGRRTYDCRCQVWKFHTPPEYCDGFSPREDEDERILRPAIKYATALNESGNGWLEEEDIT